MAMVALATGPVEDAGIISDLVSNLGVPLALLVALLWMMHKHLIPRHLRFVDTVEKSVRAGEVSRTELLEILRDQSDLMRGMLEEQAALHRGQDDLRAEMSSLRQAVQRQTG